MFAPVRSRCVTVSPSPRTNISIKTPPKNFTPSIHRTFSVQAAKSHIANLKKDIRSNSFEQQKNRRIYNLNFNFEIGKIRYFSEQSNDSNGENEEKPPKLAQSSLVKIGRPFQSLKTPAKEIDRVMVVTNKVPIFPGANVFLTLNEKQHQEVMQWETKGGGVGIFMAKDPEGVITEVDHIYSIGVFAKILPYKEHTVRLLASTRIKATDLVPHPEGSGASGMVVKVDRVKDEPYDKDDKDLNAYTAELDHAFTEYLELYGSQQTKDGLIVLGHSDRILQSYKNLDDIGEKADFVAGVLQHIDAKQLQDCLETVNVMNRTIKVLFLLRKEAEKLKIDAELKKKIDEHVASTNKRYMQQETLKAIKKELGMEKDEKQTILEEFKKRMEGKEIPQEAKDVIEEEMNRLKQLDSHYSEFNIVRNYLDWLTILPWGSYSQEILDLIIAQKTLDDDHYGLKDVKERIIEFLAMRILKNEVKGKILLFVGPPGVGKTSIGKSIAKALNREFYRFSVGGLTDVAELKGHRRTYIGALPGRLIQALKTTKTFNPVILIDEIDKMAGRTRSGDPSSVLLEILDPEQNKKFSDHYLDVHVDLSKVLFICTANTKDTIPAPLLDRMEVVQLSGYTTEEKMQIAEQYVIPRALQEAGLKPEQLKITTPALKALIRDYCREAGIRSLQRKVEEINRKSALQIVKHEKDVVTINEDNLKEYAGKPMFNSDRYYDRTPVGVVMGLAYTAYGGATLYVETVVDRLLNKPGLYRTGKLGDVMKESAEIAYSFAKGFIEEISPGNKFFETANIHMHVPEGATPKDGPSAGCTIVTALLSLALNTPIKADVSMTGEITLTGRVLPIGGVKEKIIAARRSGCKEVIFPKQNMNDVNELEPAVKGDLIIHFAEYYRDVFEVVFEGKKDFAPHPIIALRKKVKIGKKKAKEEEEEEEEPSPPPKEEGQEMD